MNRAIKFNKVFRVTPPRKLAPEIECQNELNNPREHISHTQKCKIHQENAFDSNEIAETSAATMSKAFDVRAQMA